jgi:peptidoglycan L-alanyl-D-glutamate endopeptidase CwlK
MPSFSIVSRNRLMTCHPELRHLFTEVVKTMDCTVLCGYRDQIEQDRAFRLGHSKLMFPKSKHNTYPSRAVDVVPFPLDWNDTSTFRVFSQRVLKMSRELGIEVKWGGLFTNFQDMPHWELYDHVP